MSRLADSPEATIEVVQQEIDCARDVFVEVAAVLLHVRTDGEVVHDAVIRVGKVPVQALLEFRLAGLDAAARARPRQVR